MQYTLLKNSIRGPKGQVIELDLQTARQLALNGIVALDAPVTEKRVSYDMTGDAHVQAISHGPDVVKVEEPQVLKRKPGRPRKTDAVHASH